MLLQIALSLVVMAAVRLWLSLRVPAQLRKLPAISPWQLFWSVFVRHDTMLVRQRRLEIWMFGQWVVLVNDADLAQHILSRIDLFPKANTDSPDDAIVRVFSRRFLGTNIVLSNGATWRRYRHIFSPAFQRPFDPALFVPCIDRLIRVFDQLSAQAASINVHRWMQRLTLDILGIIMFGYDFAYVTSADHAPPPTVQLYNYLVHELTNFKYTLCPWLQRIPSPWRHRFFHTVDQLDAFLYEIIQKKRDAIAAAATTTTTAAVPTSYGDASSDLLDMMIRANQQHKQHQQSDCPISLTDHVLSDKELRDNLMIFFLAGHDTTANSLAVTMYNLARYPHVQERARQEIQTILHGKPVPTFEDQKKLLYLTAIIKESLRLYPSVAYMPSRKTSVATELGGVKIPAGTLINISILGIHRNPRYWDQPDRFDPARFLQDGTDDGGGGAEPSDRHRFAWMPFGGGVRACLGRIFSLTEQRTILSMFLQHYRIILPPNSPHYNELRMASTMPLLAPLDLHLQFVRLGDEARPKQQQ